MFKYNTISYLVCILLMEIVTDNANAEEFDSATWLVQSKELETSSKQLQQVICKLMQDMGEPCDTDITRRSMAPATEEGPKKSKFTDFLALHFMNKKIVGCITQSMKDFKITTKDGERCVINPVALMRKAVLKIISTTESGLRNVVRQVKTCVTEGGGRVKCFMSLHGRILAKSTKAIKALVQLTSKSIRGVAKFSLRSTLCSVQGLKESLKASISLGKCILCAYMPSRCA